MQGIGASALCSDDFIPYQFFTSQFSSSDKFLQSNFEWIKICHFTHRERNLRQVSLSSATF